MDQNEKLKMLFKISLFQTKSNISSKWIVFYFIFFFAASYVSLSFTHETSKAAVNLMNAVLFIVPLASLLYGTIYFYNNIDYIIFILSFPVKRPVIYISLFSGLLIPMAIGFLTGIILPVLLFNANSFLSDFYIFLPLIITGIYLHLIFISFALLIAVINENKLLGFGLSIFIWLLLSVIYDGIFLIALNSFADYPLEYFSIILSVLNPIDLSRIFITINLDLVTLMGYTGAVFHNFFSNIIGCLIIFTSLTIWVLIPLFLGIRFFNKKDF